MIPPRRRCSDSSPACGAVQRGHRDLRAGRPARPGGEAALQLGLLLQQLGQAQAATRLLSQVLDRGSTGPDGDALFRAARAAHALGRPRDANSLYRAANGASADPAIDAAWGLLFLEKYNKPEALRSLQDAIKTEPEWAPAHAGLARVLADGIRRPPRRPGVRARSQAALRPPFLLAGSISTTPSTTTPREDSDGAGDSSVTLERGRVSRRSVRPDDPAAFDAGSSGCWPVIRLLRRLGVRASLARNSASRRRWRWPPRPGVDSRDTALRRSRML